MSATGIPLLIVEDNPVYAEILQRLLPTLGAELRFASKWVDSAERALDEIKATRYELVLLDYKLPGADGLTVLAEIRRLPKGEQPAVIMLTGMGNESIAVEAMKSGAMDYLPKDYLDVPSLIRAVSGALERKRLEEQVAQYTRELREKNAQMEADLGMAREVQEALLPQQYPAFPPNVPAKESALRFYHRYQPTGAVGGDFFDVFPLSDTEAGVVLCDVMGHGVRAALITAILRALVEEMNPVARDPGKFLTEINQRLMAILKQTRSPMFSSAFYLVADVRAGTLRYANAGHPVPIHVRRGAGTAEPLAFDDGQTGPALGVFEDAVYPTVQTRLAASDLVMLFTDGVFEVLGPDNEEYGQERLLAAVRQRVGRTPPALFGELLDEIHHFSADREFLDDVCLVGVEAARVGL
jgi:sigma-B regulation protein RsbU (phosphoserine phosphatase)